MIKNIYDKENGKYYHEYYCDYCFKNITYRHILRSEEGIKFFKFDLCFDCKKQWDRIGVQND